MENSVYIKRIKKLNKHLPHNNVDAILISSPSSITYLTGFSNFSTEEREAYVLIIKDPVLDSFKDRDTEEVLPLHNYIFTDGRYSTAVKESIRHFKLVEIGSGRMFQQALEHVLEKHAIKHLGIEENNLQVHEYKIIQPLVEETKHFSLSSLRMIKTSDEISAIKRACTLGDEAFAYALNLFEPRITEKSLAWEIEKFVKERGAELSFKTIVAFDANAAVPHHQTGDKKLGKKGLILIDMGVKVDNYCSDMTRTVFLGKATEEQKKVYQTVLDAQQRAIEFLNSQFSILNSNPTKQIFTANVDKAARDHITYAGFPTIPHSLGHGIGLEVHEAPTLSPRSDQTLEEGMVFSIEPGIYLPHKLGIRIEDLFVIDKQNLRQLTTSSKNLTEL
jgi:Xaa-Pro aminopeptidase